MIEITVTVIKKSSVGIRNLKLNVNIERIASYADQQLAIADFKAFEVKESRDQISELIQAAKAKEQAARMQQAMLGMRDAVEIMREVL